MGLISAPADYQAEFTEAEMLQYIRVNVRTIYPTQAAFCEAAGINPTYLSHVMHGRARPGKKFLEFFGFTEARVYRQKS